MKESCQMLDPRELVQRTRRFDLIYKIALVDAWHRGEESAIHLATEAYLEQIRAAVDFHEEDNGKNTPADYISAIRELYESVKSGGYRQDGPPVPLDENGDLAGGAHRTAVCYVLGLPVPAIKIGSRRKPPTDRDFLARRHMHAAAIAFGDVMWKKYAPQSVCAGMAQCERLLRFPDWRDRSRSAWPRRLREHVLGGWQMFQSFLRCGDSKKRSRGRAAAHFRRASGYLRMADFLDELEN